MDHIFHLTTVAAWQKALEDGIYHSPTFAAEGFIHCSDRAQVAGSANRHFKGQTGLVLIYIDPARLFSEVRYENLSGGENLFPHIYGPINLEAVENVESFEPGADGIFKFQ